MRTIVHLSDLHFGTVDKKKIAPLLMRINALEPDLVVISGDLTSRATVGEYKEARAFVRALQKKTLVVPGNHDIPFYNLWGRLLTPFARFNRYISPVSSDVYIDEEIAVIGMNTVQRFAFTRGRLTDTELTRAETMFEKAPEFAVRVVFTHHPIELPPVEKNVHTHGVVYGGTKAIARLAKAKVDVFLSGHLHVFNVTDTSARYKIEGYSGVVIQAGTALSTRLRGKSSSFNVLQIQWSDITVLHYQYQENVSEFQFVGATRFTRTAFGWKKDKP